MTDADTEFQNPSATPYYLRQQGWLKIVQFDDEEAHSEYYFRKFEEGDDTVDVLLEMTLGGRYKFLVGDPPETVREAAHDGTCLTRRGVPDLDGVCRVHAVNAGPGGPGGSGDQRRERDVRSRLPSPGAVDPTPDREDAGGWPRGRGLI